ncbi:DNA polymerase III subunit beta, partial [Escherichia coli]|nr:DNA polymerase III subunit beta [Escherichia coli]
MKLTCTKAELLGPLSRVAAVANPKSTMPILANVLLTVDGGRLSMTCSDLESELVSSIPANGTDGAITVP